MRETLEGRLLAPTLPLPLPLPLPLSLPLPAPKLETLKTEVVECELSTGSLEPSLNLCDWRLQLSKCIRPHHETLGNVIECTETNGEKLPEKSTARCWALWQKFQWEFESAGCSSVHAWLRFCLPPRLPSVQLPHCVSARRNLLSQLHRASPLWQNLTRPRLGLAASIATWQTGIQR